MTTAVGADEADLRDLTWPQFGEDLSQRLGVPRGDAVHRGDHVAFGNARLRRGAVLDHSGDGYPRGLPVVTHHRAGLNPECGPPGIGHLAGLDELAADELGRIGRASEADADPRAAELLIGRRQRRDADDLTSQVNKGPAAVARVNRG